MQLLYNCALTAGLHYKTFTERTHLCILHLLSNCIVCMQLGLTLAHHELCLSSTLFSISLDSNFTILFCIVSLCTPFYAFYVICFQGFPNINIGFVIHISKYCEGVYLFVLRSSLLPLISRMYFNFLKNLNQIKPLCAFLFQNYVFEIL